MYIFNLKNNLFNMSNCCNQHHTITVVEKIKYNMKDELTTFKEIMPDILKKLGPVGKINNLTTEEVNKLIAYNNMFLNAELSGLKFDDVVSSILNMKTFYYDLMRGNIPIEEEPVVEPIIQTKIVEPAIKKTIKK